MGAKLVESAQDVLDELVLETTQPANTFTGQQAAQEQESESALLHALGFDACSLDALQARTGLPTPSLLAELMTLELEGMVARLPGGLYQRLVHA
jgi:DNA processing protein